MTIIAHFNASLNPTSQPQHQGTGAGAKGDYKYKEGIRPAAAGASCHAEATAKDREGG